MRTFYNHFQKGGFGVTISIDDLGAAAQRRAMQLYAAARGRGDAEPEKGNKYHAEKVDRGKLKFDSRKEARRYDALVVLQSRGEIADLRVQPEFTLIEAYVTPDGERVRAMRYRADFSYRRGGELIVEDVKSQATRTRVYLNKRKMMLDKYGITVTEV